MAPHPRGFTDNFGLDTHGTELHNRAKSAQIMAAESCFMGTTDGQVINMLQQPPRRVIKVREAWFTAEQIVRRQHYLMKYKYPTQERSVRGTKLKPILEIVISTSKDTLSALYEPKQHKGDFDEYFEKTRKSMTASQESLAEDVTERFINGLDNESLDRNDTSTLEGEDQIGLHTLRALKEKCRVAAGLHQQLLLMIFGHGDPKTYGVAIGGSGHPRKAPRLWTVSDGRLPARFQCFIDQEKDLFGAFASTLREKNSFGGIVINTHVFDMGGRRLQGRVTSFKYTSRYSSVGVLFRRMFLGQGLLGMPVSYGLKDWVFSGSSARCLGREYYPVVSGACGIAATDRSLENIYSVAEEIRRTEIEVQKNFY